MRFDGKMSFNERFRICMDYDRMVMERKRKSSPGPCGSGEAEINWTDIMISILYRIKISGESMVFRSQKEMIRAIRENMEHIDWTLVSRIGEGHDMNRAFMEDFFYDADWSAFINDMGFKTDNPFIDFVATNGFIDWDAVFSSGNVPCEFLIKYKSCIDWNAFLRYHDIHSIPAELWTVDELVAAARNNPEFMNLRCNRAALSEMSTGLKKFVWIDRTAGVEGHYQDDTGLWVDTLRGQAADDSDNLESDLEHSDYEAYHDMFVMEDECII